MKRNEVIQRFCRLASAIGSSNKFHSRLAYDCFCTELQPHDGYQFDPALMEAIEEACAKEFNFEVEVLR